MHPHDVPVKVFLADDSDLICDRVAAMLSAAGMEVVGRCATPIECFNRILASQPDVVVLDVQLAGGSGLEVLRCIRLAAPSVAFVVFSNNAGPAYRRRYLAEGARQFVDKSSEAAGLTEAVARAAIRAVH